MSLCSSANDNAQGDQREKGSQCYSSWITQDERDLIKPLYKLDIEHHSTRQLTETLPTLIADQSNPSH